MDILTQCDEFVASGTDIVLVTVLKATEGTPGKPGFKMIVTRDGESVGTVGGGALERHAQQRAKAVFDSGQNDFEDIVLAEVGMECGGNAVLTYEYLGARAHFLLVGGGHVGRALLPILESIGFLVTVFDNRQGIINGIQAKPGRTLVCGPYESLEALEGLEKTVDYIFIATQGHLHDYAVIKQLLSSGREYRYIGLIGSRRKISATCARIEEDGLHVPEYLYGPVGLHIGGDTAEEIAVSIAAEVVAIKNNVDAPHLKTAKSSNS